MASDGLVMNGEARFRRRAIWGWRVALFLFALAFGATAWEVVLEPAWAAASLQQNLGADTAALGRAVLRAALTNSPAILLTLAAWDGAVVLRRYARGAALGRGLSALLHMGLAIALAGLMQIFGAPTLLAMLNEGGRALRFDLDAAGIALLSLGIILRLAARALRES